MKDSLKGQPPLGNTDEANNIASNTVPGEQETPQVLTNVFPGSGFGSAASEATKKANIFNKIIAFVKKPFEEKEKSLTEKASDDQAPKRLPNPKAAVYRDTNFQYVTILNNCDDSYTSEQRDMLLGQIAKLFAGFWHITTVGDEIEALASYDTAAIIAAIKSLRGKIGANELAVMVLIALLVKTDLYHDSKLFYQTHIKSESRFFKVYGEVMGISSSSVRDYAKRGMAFLSFRKDFLEGIEDISGIPLNEFVVSHMSKLTLYERAVNLFGRKEALAHFKSLSFREFQEKISETELLDGNSLTETPERVMTRKVPARKAVSDHSSQKEMILGLNLAPNEKRALHIIAKGGCYCVTEKLTEDQVAQVEARLRQRRIEIVENNLKMAPAKYQRRSFNGQAPLAFLDNLDSFTNVNDIILQIRSNLALIIPARRAIAVLVYRLYSEKKWQRPRIGVEYTSFQDFAGKELGMGEEYRDYIAVGKVLRAYYYFLDNLSDSDTELVFFKLKYLPKALATHKGNEPLVLARLRSLTVREFQTFSNDPDFEITFSKKLGKNQLEKLTDVLHRTRDTGW